MDGLKENKRANTDFVDKGSRQELKMLKNLLSIYEDVPDDPMYSTILDKIHEIE